jgi:EAL domain-containing protein (putative c-di-GMP-specific phosphodiesterase class I)
MWVPTPTLEEPPSGADRARGRPLSVDDILARGLVPLPEPPPEPLPASRADGRGIDLGRLLRPEAPDERRAEAMSHATKDDLPELATGRGVARACRSREDRGPRHSARPAPEARATVRERWLLGLLVRALAGRGFFLVVQRIAPLDAARGDVALCEVLLRLRSPGGGTLLPGTFLPVAARHGLLSAIDRWVVAATLAWLQRHRDRLRRPLRLAVNLTARSVADPDFLDLVLRALRRAGVPPSLLAFEITESEAIPDLVQAARFVGRLRGLGCRFALDDFGRGCSSLSHVKSLPVDMIKVDGSFVRTLDRRDRAVIGAVQHLADALGVETVAELVESRGTLESVRALGLHFAQGYAIAHPRPLDDLLAA